MERQTKVFVQDKAKEQVEVAPPPWENFKRSNNNYGKPLAGKPTTNTQKQKNAASPSEEGVVIQKETKEKQKLRLSGLGLTYVALGMLSPKQKTKENKNAFLTPKEYRKTFGKNKKSKTTKALPTPKRGPKAPRRIVKENRSELNKKQIVKAIVTQENVGHNYQKPTKTQKQKERKNFITLQTNKAKIRKEEQKKKRKERIQKRKERIQEICGDWHSIATDWRLLNLVNSNLIQGDC